MHPGVWDLICLRLKVAGFPENIIELASKPSATEGAEDARTRCLRAFCCPPSLMEQAHHFDDVTLEHDTEEYCMLYIHTFRQHLEELEAMECILLQNKEFVITAFRLGIIHKNITQAVCFRPITTLEDDHFALVKALNFHTLTQRYQQHSGQRVRGNTSSKPSTTTPHEPTLRATAHGKAKFCHYHPESTSHNTEECRQNPAYNRH
jgi:hypothetical protein